MASRIDDTFARLRRDGRAGLVAFAIAGDPNLPRSGEVLVALARAGADILEVGVPFSDPMADGPVIQRAAERALASGATLSAILDLVASRRTDIAAPVVIFTYANPLLRMGVAEFTRRAARAGVDGVLVVDLPVEEASDVRDALAAADIDMIFLLSPTSTDGRIREAARLGRGFLYGISRLGVTGARAALADGARPLVERIRTHTALPVAVGFGVSRPEHVREIAAWAEAAVVGSSLVGVIGETGDAPELIARVEAHMAWLRSGLGAA